MLISWQLRPLYSYSPDNGGLNDLIDCNLAYGLFASLCLLLLCIGAFMALFSLVVIARRYPKLGISSYFKPNPVDYLPRAPCNSPTLPRARRRMKPLRPLSASWNPRPIARVPAFSNLREGVVYKVPGSIRGQLLGSPLLRFTMLDQLEGQQPLAALLLAPMSKPNRFPTAYIPLPFSNGFYGFFSQQEIRIIAHFKWTL